MISQPFLADGIDFPLVLLYGLAVLVPIMLFQVGVEGIILSRTWRLSFNSLALPVLVANCWSLLAGIPTKFANAGLYSRILPHDLFGFFSWYPLAATGGTLIYFVVTLSVEALYFWRWAKREGVPMAPSKLWLGVVLANTATYATLGPLHYFATRPIQNVTEFTRATTWAVRPATRLIYIDSGTRYLKAILSDGSNPHTLVPIPVTNYLVTSNLETILFQDPEGDLRICHSDTGEARLTSAEDLRILGGQTTFGPPAPEKWVGEDSFKDWKAWTVPGLGNGIFVYQTNNFSGSLVRVAINPGMLHISNFDFLFSHPAFISDGRECLFQERDAIYLLDVEHRRVGKVANGNHFILLTPHYSKAPPL